MTVRKLNKKKLSIFCVVVLIILVTLIIGIRNLVNESKLRKTPQYRLSEVGYSTNEVKAIIKYLDDKKIEMIVNKIPNELLTDHHKEYIIIYLKKRRDILLNMELG